ncbi:MAG: hypothetical protein GX557_07945, partial [Chloroflexi bacterium]|nr:hypothetical protein [Chloroflexota bacterium]
MSGRYPNLPLDKARPNPQRFIDTVMGRTHPERPPMVEYIIDDALRRPILTGMLGREWVSPVAGDAASMAAYLDNFIYYWRAMGYDFVRFEEGLGFREESVSGADQTTLAGQRSWRDMHSGLITSWADFERYPWPVVTDEALARTAYLAEHLPDDMGLMTCHGGGPYEHLAGAMSYEPLCLALYDQPDLVEAVAQRIGELMFGYYQRLVQLPNLIALFQGDDMGFRSMTLLPPDALRRYTLPWHKRFAALAHAHGLPYFVHSCGNMLAVMPDLIDDAQIDAKHSFENAIIPVEAFQARYGDRIGVLGGVDIDILGRHT